MTIFMKILKASKESVRHNWIFVKKNVSSRRFWCTTILTFLLHTILTLFAANLWMLPIPDKAQGQIGYITTICASLIIGFIEVFRIKLKNRFVKILYYIGIFLFFELIIYIPLVKLIGEIPSDQNNDTWIIFAFINFTYPLILYAVMNSFNNFMLIYHTIYRTEDEQVYYACIPRAFLVILSVFCLMMSSFLIFNPWRGFQGTFVFCQFVLMITFMFSGVVIRKTQSQTQCQAIVDSRLVHFLFKAMRALNFQFYFIPILLCIVKVIFDEVHAMLHVSPFAREFVKLKEFEAVQHRPFEVIILYTVFSIGNIEGIWWNLKEKTTDDTDQQIKAETTTQTMETDV